MQVLFDSKEIVPMQELVGLDYSHDRTVSRLLQIKKGMGAFTLKTAHVGAGIGRRGHWGSWKSRMPL